MPIDFGISTSCFGQSPVTVDSLERLRRADFSILELHAMPHVFNYSNRSFLRSIARWFGENALPAPSLHLPFQTHEEDILAPSPLARQRANDQIKRCLELTDLLPLDFAVLHLGVPGQSFNPVAFDHAYATVSMIQSFSGARVLLETLQNDIATFERIREFQTVAQTSNIGICYDTGHGEIGRKDDRAVAMHLDDSEPEHDDHLWPFEGKRNWPALIEQIVLRGFEGRLILEAKDDRLAIAADSRSQLKDLFDEAQNSIEEFRLKYKLPAPRQEEEE